MKHLRIILPVIAVIAAVATGCNEDDDSSKSTYVQTSNCAVNGFSIQPNSKVMTNLDSVFFSIDLDKGLIFNADSLPVGADVSALVPVISYPNTIRGAMITMTGGRKREGVIDYLNNPSDTVDFTGDVTLRLTAEDGVSMKEYRIKVNVHKMKPDSLQWNPEPVASLPSRMANPTAQKTITYGSGVYSMLQESDGSYTLSSTTSLMKPAWTRNTLSLDFTPQVRSFSCSDNALYMLSQSGELFTSSDGRAWTSTGAVWASVIGGYEETLLGVRHTSEGYKIASYPAGKIAETDIPDGFPVSGFTNPGVFSTKWATQPYVLLYGGRDAQGNIVDTTWGFDGSSWAAMSEHKVPGLADATLIPYFIYREFRNLWIVNEYSVWLLAGGVKADGSVNHDVFISYDNGINWRHATASLSLPDFIPPFAQADAVILNTPYEKDIDPRLISGRTPRTLPYEIDGYNVKWNCPYIYLFGGRSSEGNLYNTVWRGVINRMTFRPIF